MIEGKIFNERTLDGHKEHFCFDSPDKEMTEKIVKALRGLVKFKQPTANF